MSALEAAVRLASRGYAVLPVDPESKRPVTAHGSRDASTTPAAVRALFDGRPRAGVAIATGLASAAQGRALVVIDVDPRSGGVEGLEAAQAAHGALPATARASTPSGGWHAYYRAPAGVQVRNSASALAPGVDVRGEGGYVVAPPGAGRTWSGVPTPAELPPRWLAACDTRDRPTPGPRVVVPPARTLEEAQAATAAAGGDYLRTIPPARYFAIFAGAIPDASGKVRCPLPDHPDRTPSCHLFPDGWRCFGCGRGGSIYDLVGYLVGASFPLRGAEFLAVQGAIYDALEARTGVVL